MAAQIRGRVAQVARAFAMRAGVSGLLSIGLFILALTVKLVWFSRATGLDGNPGMWYVSIGSVVAAACWAPLAGPRTRVIVLTSLDLLLTALILSDLLYYRYFQGFLSIPLLFQASQLGQVHDSIWSLLHATDLLMFTDIPFAIALTVWVCLRVRRRRRNGAPARSSGIRHAWYFRWVTAGALLGLAGGLIATLPVRLDRDPKAQAVWVTPWWGPPEYQLTGLLGWHARDVYDYAADHLGSGRISKQDMHTVQNWFDQRRQRQHEATQTHWFGSYRGTNVLVVQVEALQKFVIGLEVGGQPVTPYLNNLVNRSRYFPNFFHQVGQGHTSDAELLAGCSLHGTREGAAFVRYADHTYTCLPKILHEHGYDATVHHAFYGSFFNRSHMYPRMGYQRAYFLPDYVNNEPLGWSVGDKSFLRQTVGQIQERGKQPFYALAITLTSHHPYNLPRLHSDLDVGSLQGTILGNYLQAIHYTDAAIGTLVQQLQNQGLWDNTIVMLYGDHDDGIDDPALYRRLFDHPRAGLTKASFAQRVPFLIHFPGDKHAGVDKTPVGEIDVAPTVLQLLGIPVGSAVMMGTSVFTRPSTPVVFRDGGYADSHTYFVPGDTGLVADGQCYAIDTGDRVDPQRCRAGAARARQELTVSDLVLQHNLVPRLRHR